MRCRDAGLRERQDQGLLTLMWDVVLVLVEDGSVEVVEGTLDVSSML